MAPGAYDSFEHLNPDSCAHVLALNSFTILPRKAPFAGENDEGETALDVASKSKSAGALRILQEHVAR